MAKGKNVFTTGDVARICNVAPRTVSKWFDEGHLKGYRIPGSKDRRIPINELVRFMKEHNMPLTSLPVGELRVLLIKSDEKESQKIIEKMSEKVGYSFEYAPNIFKAGIMIQKFSPHVIIIDLDDKKINRKMISETLADDPDTEAIKIIAIKSGAKERSINSLVNDGFDAVISETDNIDNFIRKVEEATALTY